MIKPISRRRSIYEGGTDMMKQRGKHLVFASLGIVILSGWLLLAAWLNTPPVDAQDVLDEDEIVALAAWGADRLCLALVSNR